MDKLLDTAHTYVQNTLEQFGFKLSEDISDFVSRTTIYRNSDSGTKDFISFKTSSDWREDSTWDIDYRLGNGDLELEDEPIELEFSSVSLIELGGLEKEKSVGISLELSYDDLSKLIQEFILLSEDFLHGKTKLVLDMRRKRNQKRIESPFPNNPLEKTLEMNDFSEQEAEEFTNDFREREEGLRVLLRKFS